MTGNEPSTAESRLALAAVRLREAMPAEGDLVSHPLAAQFAEALQAYLPEALGRKHRRWALESLDHAALTLLHFNGDHEIEAAGLCVLTWDPTTMPFHVHLRIAKDGTGFPTADCRAGEVDSVTGQVVRLAWGSRAAASYSDRLNDRLHSMCWMYEVEVSDA